MQSRDQGRGEIAHGVQASECVERTGRLYYLQVALLLCAGKENQAILSTVRAVVREGKIEWSVR